MFFIVSEKAGSTITVVGHLEPGTLQALNQAGGAQRRWSFFGTGLKGCGAGRGADQGNLLRLTGDFDRQSLAPGVVFPSAGLGYGFTAWLWLFHLSDFATGPWVRRIM
jgi:hypothetical protein